MLSTKPLTELPAQLDDHKVAVINQLISGSVVEIVFTKVAPREELAGLQVLERAGVILLTDRKRASISLWLTNKSWPDLPEARTFRLTITNRDTAAFWRQIQAKHLGEVTKIT